MYFVRRLRCESGFTQNIYIKLLPTVEYPNKDNLFKTIHFIFYPLLIILPTSPKLDYFLVNTT